MRAIQTHEPLRVPKCGEATRRPYTPDAPPAGRLAPARGVRQEPPRKAALALPRAPRQVEQQRLRPSSRGMAKRPSAPPEVLVVVIILVLGPLLPVAVPTRLA